MSLLLFPCNFEAVASESARPEKLPGGICKVGTKQDCCHSNEKDECCTGVQWNTRWSVDSEVGMVESLRRGKSEERERERYGRKRWGRRMGGMGEEEVWERERYGRGRGMGEGEVWERERYGRGRGMGEGEVWERERYGRRIMSKKVGEVRERCDENCIHVPGWFPHWCWR